MVAGGHYHVMNRGNNRATIFTSQRDYAAFIRHMHQAQARVQVRTLAACLMPNHFHLVLAQDGAEDISRWMHWLLTKFGTHHHERHASSGRLWQGRFKAFPIEEDAHLLTVMRYVERNALRSGLVKRAEQWPWGSLAWRQDDVNDLLTRPPLQMPSDWARLVNEPQTPQELTALRECATRQRPFGDDAWARRTAGAHGQEWTLRPPGRPRKNMPATAPNPTRDLPLGCEK